MFSADFCGCFQGGPAFWCNKCFLSLGKWDPLREIWSPPPPPLPGKGREEAEATRKSQRGTGGAPVQAVLMSWPPHRCVGGHLKVPGNCLPRRTGSWVFTRRLCLFLVGGYLRAELLPAPQRKPSGCETERPEPLQWVTVSNPGTALCLHLEVDPDLDQGDSSVGLRGNFWLRNRFPWEYP